MTNDSSDTLSHTIFRDSPNSIPPIKVNALLTLLASLKLKLRILPAFRLSIFVVAVFIPSSSNFVPD